jgi:hypothetical protein
MQDISKSLRRNMEQASKEAKSESTDTKRERRRQNKY